MYIYFLNRCSLNQESIFRVAVMSRKKEEKVLNKVDQVDQKKNLFEIIP